MGMAFEEDMEVRVSFVGKKGKKRTLPVWFTSHDGVLELLPMHGLRTKWFEDLEPSGKLTVRGWKETREGVPRVVRDAAEVDRIKGRFAKKYGEGDVRRFYPTSEVALLLDV